MLAVKGGISYSANDGIETNSILAERVISVKSQLRQTDMTQYMDFAVLMFFAFGIAFEIPVATVLLVRTGLVRRETLAKNRGYVILGIFIVAAFLTPPDPISQTMMAIPMYLLYEAGVLMSRVLVRAQQPDPEGDPA
jgi:sec-independent protein translocase protein TatC